MYDTPHTTSTDTAIDSLCELSALSLLELQLKREVSAVEILDAHLAGREFIALDRLTLAEATLAPIVKRCLEFPIERPALAEVNRWQAAIDQRPAFAVAIGAKSSALTPAA